MTLTKPNEEPGIDPRLEKELLQAAQRQRDNHLFRGKIRRWGIASVLIGLCIGLRWVVAEFEPYAFPTACIVVLATLILNFLESRRTPLNYRETGKLVEENFPELDKVLTTALEQRPKDGKYNFLQEKVIEEALHNSLFQYWEDTGKRSHILLQLGYVASLVGAVALAGLVYHSKGWAGWSGGAPLSIPAMASSVEVTPGDVELQRGSAVVVAARFMGQLPKSATLQTRTPSGKAKSFPMARSLSDPVFAHTLPAVSEDTLYSVTFEEGQTESYTLSVYDLPMLKQADAYLDYPAYTGLTDRRIEDTRRVSAVEGTRIDYTFLVNKPVAQALLVDKTTEVIELKRANPQGTRFTTSFTLGESRHYHLHLKDEAGRNNAYPPDISIEALPNKRPKLRVNFPKGDQRVSPIEELTLEAEAKDDFGLINYGVALAVGANNPVYTPLKKADSATLDADFRHTVALEEKGVEPDELVTWFAFAEDYGPDGELRRSTSDLYFAEVRALEEIFRQGESGGGSMEGMGGQREGEILERQRQIAIATWKLLQRGESDSSFREDSEVLAQSQREIWSQLQAALLEMRRDDWIKAAQRASGFMEKAADKLSEANAEHSEAPLQEAWLAAQGAYQALLSLQPREFNVVRQGNQRSGGGSGNRRNQRQLNQIDFNEEENRYETESQAQPLTTPEERNQLEVLGKLSELARRQQQMNERLKELQTALTSAKDEEEEQRIRRELKRLEEENRRLLTQVDEVRQRMERMDSDRETREARRQLDETRQEMRQLGQSLDEGKVSQALASGARANENLQDLKEDFRQDTSSRFTEQLRRARDAARELAENQKKITEALDHLSREGAHRLDLTPERAEVNESYEGQLEGLGDLMDNLRRITEDSEIGEPNLHRRLYDLLRRSDQSGTEEDLRIAQELVQRGFTDHALERQPGLEQAFDDLRREVEAAAESVLGSETRTLRFASEELDELSRQLENERPREQESMETEGRAQPGESPQADELAQGTGREPGGSRDSQQPSQAQGGQRAGGQQPGPVSGQGGLLPPGDGARRGGDDRLGGGAGGPGGNRLGDLEDIIRSLADNSRMDGPITGGEFRPWSERLRTVEELIEQPQARERITEAREAAERLRAEFKRHSLPPQWDSIDTSVLEPMREVKSWVQQELMRLQDPEVLQPIDRDPVPPPYQEAVKRYYEALGDDS